ncbi:uncharacterized protein MYCGRDRAFT_97965 [Zymoseptoria tritici IPO323]|uniref:Uncharacterized protein n=1 Tax=Zymoseptoria tritici (strain CBS 115943 / IPO323) TaxID=336722 RepID=F9XRX1_ZYMTI|nr:uncharacterized protein MYCGRDRAFT_97965 [Zymoseptoria tritici IPO323]EGP82027.1 hypothetical protein MYCGRDRAFT_97965 [Zymoseptoria tritici IPO323]
MPPLPTTRPFRAELTNLFSAKEEEEEEEDSKASPPPSQHRQISTKSSSLGRAPPKSGEPRSCSGFLGRERIAGVSLLRIVEGMCLFALLGEVVRKGGEGERDGGSGARNGEGQDFPGRERERRMEEEEEEEGVEVLDRAEDVGGKEEDGGGRVGGKGVEVLDRAEDVGGKEEVDDAVFVGE